MSLINKDIDTILIKLLLIDDLRNLYQTSRYYHNLIKPLLEDYIYFYSNVKHIGFFDMNDGLLLESVKYGKLHVCEYNYAKHAPIICYPNNISSNFPTIYEYAFEKACMYGHIDIAKWIHKKARYVCNNKYVSQRFDDFAYAHFNVLLERYQKN